MASVAALVVLLLAGALPAYATNYIVGDNSGWELNVNYANWASGKTFKVGDTLLFKYSNAHSVEEVNQADYNSCSTSKPISTYTDGNTSITLNTTGSWYFICGTPGHCQAGMKLEVTVSGTSNTPSTPTPPSPPSGSPAPPSGSTSPPPPTTNGPSTQPPPPPTTNGPSTQPPPPPPPSSGAMKNGFYGMSAALLGALLMVLALVC